MGRSRRGAAGAPPVRAGPAAAPGPWPPAAPRRRAAWLRPRPEARPTRTAPPACRAVTMRLSDLTGGAGGIAIFSASGRSTQLPQLSLHTPLGDLTISEEGGAIVAVDW